MKEKLLIVAHHLTIGGVQKSLISALKALDYDKYDVTLYLRKNRTVLLPYVDERVNVVVNKDTNKYYRKPYAIALQSISVLLNICGLKSKARIYDKKLADTIRKRSMEYEHNTYFKGIVYSKAIAYVQGYEVQFVDEYVNAEEKFMFFHTSTDEIHDVHEKSLPNFKRIAALHNEQAELIKKWYPGLKDRIAVVENYVDRNAVISQSKEYEIEKPDNKTVLCSCGRLSPVKGFDLAIECAKILKDKGFSFVWYFVGDGPEREKLEKAIDDNDLNNYITITGMKENPYPYIKTCDIYIQPSYEEAMPVTIIESLKLSKPVITTATVGGSKLITNGLTGLIADIDAADLSEKILELLSDKELYKEITTILQNTDDSDAFNKFKEQWKNLLEG